MSADQEGRPGRGALVKRRRDREASAFRPSPLTRSNQRWHRHAHERRAACYQEARSFFERAGHGETALLHLVRALTLGRAADTPLASHAARGIVRAGGER